MCILATYYTPDILKPDYQFSESGTYRVPDDGSLSDYLVRGIWRQPACVVMLTCCVQNVIDQLPLNDHPEVFGMHENANITVALNETNGT